MDHLHSSPFIAFYFAFTSFHFALMSSHVSWLCIKNTGLRKLMCQHHLKPVRWVSIQALTISSSLVLLSFSYPFGALCGSLFRLHEHICIYIYMMCMSSLSAVPSDRILGWKHIGNVKVQVKLKCNARVLSRYPIWSTMVGLHQSK